MNILSLNTQTAQYTPNFGAKPVRTNLINNLSSDIVEITSKTPDILPKQIILTELEEKFNKILVELHRLQMNIKTQKENLKYYYSAQDKADYQELLKKKQSVMGRLKRLAKTAGIDVYKLECNLTEKKDYNRFAPKIYAAQSKEELNKVEKLIYESRIYRSTKELLDKLIAQRKNLL